MSMWHEGVQDLEPLHKFKNLMHVLLGTSYKVVKGLNKVKINLFIKSKG